MVLKYPMQMRMGELSDVRICVSALISRNGTHVCTLRHNASRHEEFYKQTHRCILEKRGDEEDGDFFSSF